MRPPRNFVSLRVMRRLKKFQCPAVALFVIRKTNFTLSGEGGQNQTENLVRHDSQFYFNAGYHNSDLCNAIEYLSQVEFRNRHHCYKNLSYQAL